MAGRGTDILLGGNAEHMARQQAIGGVAEKLLKGEEVRRRRGVCLLLHGRQLLPCQDRGLGAHLRFFKQECDDHKDVVSLGGLHIVGTERHEARRIDNQLRGRAGARAIPALPFLPLARRRPDAHLRLGPISGLMQRLGMEGVPIEHGMVTRHRAGPEAGGRPELLGPQAPARSTTT